MFYLLGPDEASPVVPIRVVKVPQADKPVRVATPGFPGRYAARLVVGGAGAC